MSFKEKLRQILNGLPGRVKIERQYVGKGEPVYIIAEVGINHNGDLLIAKKLIDVAAEAGVSAVKFQKRTPEEILTREGLLKPYISPHAFAPTYGEHRKKLEFGESEYQELISYAGERNVAFFASVWDFTSADFMERLGVHAFKIPSADLINTPLLAYVAQKQKPMILSTGMSTPAEIDEAVRVVLKHNNRLLIMHCVSLYPCAEDRINLRFMDVLREKYSPLPVGYSGHEIGMLPTLAAVSRGATILERHITLDKTMKGSDHAASLEPHEFKSLVSSVRQVETILGRPEKVLYPELFPMREKLAKSVVAKSFIPAGTVITADMLLIKGPGHGIKPSFLPELVGRVAKINIAKDTHLPLEALQWPRKFI